MSINYQALTLGECEVYLNDQHLGLASELRLHKAVERLPIERPDRAELVCHHLVPLRRALSVEVHFQELSPPALSFFLGGGTSVDVSAANRGVTDYVRLYEGYPSSIRHVPASVPLVKSADGSITYTENTDYGADWPHRSFSLLPESRILPGELLKVVYTANFQPAKDVLLVGSTTATVGLEAIHRYPDGESFLLLHLRRVEVDAGGILAMGSADLVEVPLVGRCLADANYPASPFGYVRLHGTLMSRLGNRP